MEQDSQSQSGADAAAPPAPAAAGVPANDAAAQPPAGPPKPKTKTISTELLVEERLPIVYDVQKYTDVEVRLERRLQGECQRF